MYLHSPLFAVEDAPRSAPYRFVFLAARELLRTARKWRNDIEEHNPHQPDLAEAERQLAGAVESLEIWLNPPTKDGKIIDPRDREIWEDESELLPGIVRVNIADQLARSRDKPYSAFGFFGRSACEVVGQLGRATLKAVGVLAAGMHTQALGSLLGPTSVLRTEIMGLGKLPVERARQVEADCLWEAERAWRAAKGDQGSGGDGSAPTAKPGEGEGNGEGSTTSGQSLPASTREAILQQLEPAVRKAYLAFQYAETLNGRQMEDREAYNWLHENGIDEGKGDLGQLTDYELPSLETFRRYLGTARRPLGESKYTRRGGRKHGRSIARGNEIEYQKGDGR